jgi:sialate O-acetylesterase
LGNELSKTHADSTGNWRVNLDPITACANALELRVTGKNTVFFKDVLLGDVWVCSGQSNMYFALGQRNGLGGASNSAEAIPTALDRQLRFFVVGQKISLRPLADLKGEWRVCTPESAASFSAVGFFFGRELRRTLDRPIGLIGSYCSGVPAQSFISLSGLEKAPPFATYIETFRNRETNYAKARADYASDFAAYWAQLQEWKSRWWQRVIKHRWIELEDLVFGTTTSTSETPPLPPELPEGMTTTPTEVYNGMIAPIIPYGIKGVIWYQGEVNVDRGLEYRTLFPRLIPTGGRSGVRGISLFSLCNCPATMCTRSKTPGVDGRSSAKLRRWL